MTATTLLCAPEDPGPRLLSRVAFACRAYVRIAVGRSAATLHNEVPAALSRMRHALGRTVQLQYRCEPLRTAAMTLPHEMMGVGASRRAYMDDCCSGRSDCQLCTSKAGL